MSAGPGFDLVIFDCDGVLVDSEALSCAVLAELLTELGCPTDGPEVARRFAGLTDRAIAAQVTAERGIVLPEDFARQVSRRAIAAFEGRLQAVPGAHEAVAAATGPRCVASNSGPARLERCLEIVGLRDRFPADGLFSSAQVAQPKPAPDLHLHAAAAFAAEPGRCVVIEDSATGVAAAVAAGMTAIGFVGAGHIENRHRHAARLREEGAGRVIDDLRDLSAALAVLAA